MSYFVTGATGFIGRNLVELLLEREGTIYVLVREGSKGRLEELRNRWGADPERIVPIVGDLSEPKLGVSPEDQARVLADRGATGAAQLDVGLAAVARVRSEFEGHTRIVGSGLTSAAIEECQ